MRTRAASTLLLTFGLLAGAAAGAAPSAHNSDAVPPNPPLKERGFPDAGAFNPNGERPAPAPPVLVLAPAAPPSHAVAPAAITYPPAIVVSERAPRPYALVAAPTLPCAPGYCAPLRPRRDRH